MTYSLRSRLLAGVVAGITFVLCVFCLVIYTATRQTLIYQFDKSLLSTAKMLSAVIENENYDNDDNEQQGPQDEIVIGSLHRKIDFQFDVRAIPEFNNLYGGAYYQFRDANGITIIRSPSLPNTDLNIFKAISDIPQYTECILPDGSAGRAIGFQFIPEGGKKIAGSTLSIIVAKDISSISGHLHFLVWLLLISSAVMILLSIIVALLVTRAGLRPIHTLADEISAIDTENFQKTHISEKYPRELLPVNRCLNNLLQRIKSSFDRERRFNSDIAHELRTPLAGIQSTIEVCLSRTRQAEDYQAALRTSLQITKSMHRMIDTLLSLAKLESNQITLNYEHISLKNTVADCWQSFANRAYERKITFENRIAGDAVCFSDRDQFSIILFNILDNAIEHSNQAGRIWVKAEKSTDFVTLSISNTGCKIKQEEIPNIFDSFWRGDKSRKDTDKHCGIGLAVVQRVTRVLGGTVTAEIKPQEIFTIHLSLPVS
jgi:signal transduction histidine kinase